jgi:hypothetical protein
MLSHTPGRTTAARVVRTVYVYFGKKRTDWQLWKWSGPSGAPASRDIARYPAIRSRRLSDGAAGLHRATSGTA